MKLKYNVRELLSRYRQSIEFTNEFFSSNGDEFFRQLPWFKDIILSKVVQVCSADGEQLAFLARFTAFFIVHLPNACFTESKEVKEIILNHAIRKELIPQLKSYFTTLPQIVEEVNIIAGFGYEFDHSILLKNCLETIRGNFLRQFLTANNLATTKGNEITLLNYLIRVPLELPAIDFSNLQLHDIVNDGFNLQRFIEAVESADSNTGRRFKPFVHSIHGRRVVAGSSFEARQVIDFLTSNRYDIIRFEKLECRRKTEAQMSQKDFLLKHKKLIEIICPLYFERNVRRLMAKENGRLAYQHIQRKFNYHFERI